MLGYTLDDLDKMISSISTALDSILPDKQAYKGLDMAQEFLQGLYAEGYFSE